MLPVLALLLLDPWASPSLFSKAHCSGCPCLCCCVAAAFLESLSLALREALHIRRGPGSPPGELWEPPQGHAAGFSGSGLPQASRSLTPLQE